MRLACVRGKIAAKCTKEHPVFAGSFLQSSHMEGLKRVSFIWHKLCSFLGESHPMKNNSLSLSLALILSAASLQAWAAPAASGAPVANTSNPQVSNSAPAANTSLPRANTSAPVTSTSMPQANTSSPAGGSLSPHPAGNTPTTTAPANPSQGGNGPTVNPAPFQQTTPNSASTGLTNAPSSGSAAPTR